MALDFFAGCAGGAAGVIVGHPLDTVKVRLQTQSPDNIKYRGTFHTLSTIIKQESVFGLYKGITSPIVGVAGVNAIVFGVYGLLRPFVAGSPGNDALWAHFVAGSISGSVQSVICSPMELVKIRMQVNESAVKTTSWDVLKNISKNEGGLFRGVYKGWLTTLFREIPGFGSYFATYELLTTKTGYDVGTFGMMFAGGMAGVVSWLFCFPMDVVKTRIQMDTSNKYSGIMDCVKQTAQAEGYKAFFRGLNSSVIRAFPTNAATFTVVNWIMRFFDSKQNDLQTGRENLNQLLEEWNRERFHPHPQLNYCSSNHQQSNNSYWTRRVPNCNYISAKCLLSDSTATSTAQLIESNLKKLDSLFKINMNPNENVEEEDCKDFVQTDKQKPVYNNQDCHFVGKYDVVESEAGKMMSMPNNSDEKDTLVVSKLINVTGSEFILKEGKLISINNNNNSIHDLVRNWLLKFTFAPVHLCRCLDNNNCNCSF